MPTNTTSLKRNAQPDTAEPEVVSEAVVVTPPTSIVPAAAPSASGLVGDFDRNDTVLPSLKIVNGNGGLADTFDGGAIILNHEEQISSGEEPVKLTVVSMRKYFIENVEYGGDKRGREFDTLEQVRAVGGHTDWIDNQKPPFSPAAEAIVILESDKESPNHPFEYGGKFYAVAVWRLTGAAYTRAAKLIATAGMWSLKAGLIHGSWTLSTRKERLGKNSVFVPVLKAGPKNSVELVDFLKSIAS